MDFMGLMTKRTDYEKKTFFSRLLNKTGGGQDATSQVNLYKAKKKNGINLKRYHGINRKLLPLSIASIFFQECFVF